MKAEVWGPHAWILLHSITLEYPDNPSEDDKRNMSTFFHALGNVLPCYKCKVNFSNHLEQHPITDTVLKSKTSLVKWLIDVHNDVNKMNNKKTVTYEEGVESILRLYEEKNTNVYIYLSVIVFVIILLFILYRIFN